MNMAYISCSSYLSMSIRPKQSRHGVAPGSFVLTESSSSASHLLDPSSSSQSTLRPAISTVGRNDLPLIDVTSHHISWYYGSEQRTRELLYCFSFCFLTMSGTRRLIRELDSASESMLLGWPSHSSGDSAVPAGSLDGSAVITCESSHWSGSGQVSQVISQSGDG